jgi:hypothetical protein
MRIERIVYWISFAVVAVLIFAPVFCAVDHLDQRELVGIFPNQPAISGGDEPYYLLMLTSLVHDHDVNLRNNYENSHGGALDGGRVFAGFPYVHHSMWFKDGKQIQWKDVIQENDDPVTHKAGFIFKPGFEDLAQGPEYSWHPPALAFVLAPPAALLEPWLSLETTALLVVTSFGIISLWLLIQIFSELGFTRWQSFSFSALAILCTPWWHYNRMLFTEGSIAFAMTVALYTWVHNRNRASKWEYLAGLPFAFMMLLKLPLLIAATPFVVDACLRRRKRTLCAYGLWLAVGTAFWFLQNEMLFGSPFLMNAYPAHYKWGEVLYAMFVSLRQGLWWSCPTLLIAFFGFRICYREDKRVFQIIFSGFACYWIFLIFVHNWYGGLQYGPRYIVPFLCFIGVAVGYALRFQIHNRYRGRAPVNLAIGFVLVSALAINAYAAWLSMVVFTQHPLEILWANVRAGLGY